MSKPSINDPDLARRFGYKNAFEFWANYSGQSTGTLIDHAQYTLTKCGYTGTLDDKFNAFMHDMFGTTTPRTSMDCYNSLKGYPLSNLTFFKNYANLPTGTVTASQLNANLAKGVATATFTRTTSAAAPATYVDDNGVIQLVTTSDVGRIRGGYYDTTGFHAQKGLMIEGAGTNYCIRSLFDGGALSSGIPPSWSQQLLNSADAPTTAELLDGTALINISGANIFHFAGTQTTTATTGLLDFHCTISSESFAQNDLVTVSFYVKGSVSGCMAQPIIFEYTSAMGFLTSQTGTSISLSNTQYTKVSHTFTVSNASTARLRCGIAINALGVGDTYDIYVTGFQLEKSPYATSFIPTTTAALTRNAETLKYAISGNRTATSESIFMKFSPIFSAPGSGKYPTLLQTDTVSEWLFLNGDSNDFGWRPNATQSGSCYASGGSFSANTSLVLTANKKHSVPYAQLFKDGTSIAVDNADDFTTPGWGTYFYLGSASDGASQVNSSLQRVTFFSDAKGATDVAAITNLLNQ